MNATPTPAIVSQQAAQRLPRVLLVGLCVVYVLAGFLGRTPWKSADMTAFGYMAEMALAPWGPAWWQPRLLGLVPEVDALLPYWLGAAAIQWLGPWLGDPLAARVPFMLLLAACLVATWWAVYHLARNPTALPLAFAFGGEADPKSYARALADGGLLALLACLGLAQLAHEATPALVQITCAAAWLYAAAAMPWKRVRAMNIAAMALMGLALSGAPSIASGLAAAGALMAVLTWRGLQAAAQAAQKGLLEAQAMRTPEQIAGVSDSAFAPDSWGAGAEHSRLATRARLARLDCLFWLGCVIALLVMCTWLDLWRWRIELPPEGGREWRGFMRLLVWFSWPVWPLAAFALWNWRRHWRPLPRARHLVLPVALAGLAHLSALTTNGADRSLLVGLPGMAALAAFSLPTLKRSLAALIDWFTLLFFSGCALIIWIIWMAMVSGFPAKPAANVARLAPGFMPSFEWHLLLPALVISGAWIALVAWRTGRHRTALWKTLVLPATGAVLCWTLLMTLWLPLLDYARSFAPQIQRIRAQTGPNVTCLEAHGLSRAQIAALRHHGAYDVLVAQAPARCPWLIVSDSAQASLGPAVDPNEWLLRGVFRRPTDKNDDLLLYTRAPTRSNPAGVP